MINLDAEKTAQKLLEILKQLALELHPHFGDSIRVTLDSSLERDLSLDSLGRIELLLRIQHAFDVNLPERVLAMAETARDLLREVLASGSKGARKFPVEELRSLELGEAKAVPDHAETVLDVLDWHVQAHPDRLHICLVNESGQEEKITYGSLQRESEAVAAGLKEFNIQPGEAVAIMLPTGRDYFYAFYGILQAGGVPVPLYPPVRLSQIEDHLCRQVEILKSALASVLITIPKAKPYTWLLKPQIRTAVTIQDLLGAGGHLIRTVKRPGDTALLQYTSGSTGNPKGVILTHANLLANIRAMGRVVQADPTDVLVSWLPLYHDMGLIGACLGSLYYSILLILMSPLTFLARPERWLWAIHRYRGTLSSAPNFAYELCLRKIDDKDIRGLDLSSWRMAMNGAEPVSPDTILAFTERFGPYGFRPETMAPVYGLAEASVGLTFPPPGRRPLIDRINRQTFMRSGYARPEEKEDESAALRFVACGQPLPGHQIRIVDSTGYEAGERREGRLEFKGPSVTTGYFRNPEETRRLFHGEWLDSGDLGYMVGGDVFISGRIKDIIIRAGRSIYPHELEEAVGNLPDVRKGCVAVFGSTDPVSRTERLVVVAETRETDPGRLAVLRGNINAEAVKLLGMPPDEIVLVPPHSVPKTSSGKIRRAASRELYEHKKIAGRHPPVWRQYLRLGTKGVLSQLGFLIQTASSFLYAGYAWGLFLVFAPVVWLTVALLPRPSWCRRFLRPMTRFIIGLSGTPLVVKGRERLPSGKPYVLVANHSSYLDSLLLTAVLPIDTFFVAKRELTDQFLARVFLRRMGTRFVERFDLQRGVTDARKLADAVRGGHSPVIYAEGTFDRMPGLLPFHMGAFVIAAETGVPVVPLTIRGTRGILRAREWFPRRGLVHVTIGEPIMPEGSDWSAAVRLRDAVRLVILRHGGEPDLAPPYDGG